MYKCVKLCVGMYVYVCAGNMKHIFAFTISNLTQINVIGPGGGGGGGVGVGRLERTGGSKTFYDTTIASLCSISFIRTMVVDFNAIMFRFHGFFFHGCIFYGRIWEMRVSPWDSSTLPAATHTHTHTFSFTKIMIQFVYLI